MIPHLSRDHNKHPHLGNTNNPSTIISVSQTQVTAHTPHAHHMQNPSRLSFQFVSKVESQNLELGWRLTTRVRIIRRLVS